MIEEIYSKKNYNTFFITWSLHNFCNFRCTYCPPNLNNGTTKTINIENIKSFYTQIKTKVPNKKIIFAFSGGEPTLHPQFIDIIKYLSDNGCEICMTTNGSRGLDWWQKAEPYIDHLVISYHPQWTKKKKLIENIKFLSETTWVNLDLMMIPEYWDEIIDFSNSLRGLKNIAITYLPVQRDFGNGAQGLIDYTAEQLEFLQNPPNFYGDFLPSLTKLEKCKGQFGRGEKIVKYSDHTIKKLDYKLLIANKENNFFGYTCDLGLEGLIIEINGDIYNAYCHVGGKVGNIFEGNFNLRTSPIVCPKTYCSCSVDIEINKRAPNGK